MKVLWFEVTIPSAYISGGVQIGGWQDSLERIVRNVEDIELTILFMSDDYSEEKVVNGVKYIPIHTHWSFLDRNFRKRWDVFVDKMLPKAKQVIDDFKPDLIHIFGTEWPFGQIAKYTEIPVIIHIMGAIVPYNNASYPPGYSFFEQMFRLLCRPKKIYNFLRENRNSKNREKWENRTWQLVSNYMGRTNWDESLSRVMHPERKYFHVEEALRTEFLCSQKRWQKPVGKQLRLVSTGCGSFWKGPDMMLKVARILCDCRVDFKWQVLGHISEDLKKQVEHHEGCCFESCHVSFLGFKQPEELIDILCSSTMYVHTAYIENSPNSICEAQYLGVPVVSTNVGGISTLVRDGQDGILVPANDPWQMADAILQLAADKERMQRMSDSTSTFAKQRHADDRIKSELVNAYCTIISEYEKTNKNIH